MKHDELLKDARELASECPASNRGAAMLLALSNVVEAYDKAESEAVAACRTCDEAITELIARLDYPAPYSGPMKAPWINLRTAGHLAKRAAENWDKAKGGE